MGSYIARCPPTPQPYSGSPAVTQAGCPLPLSPALEALHPQLVETSLFPLDGPPLGLSFIQQLFTGHLLGTRL